MRSGLRALRSRGALDRIDVSAERSQLDLLQRVELPTLVTGCRARNSQVVDRKTFLSSV